MVLVDTLVSDQHETEQERDRPSAAPEANLHLDNLRKGVMDGRGPFVPLHRYTSGSGSGAARAPGRISPPREPRQDLNRAPHQAERQPGSMHIEPLITQRLHR
jgi:hypothetical protein